jgi:hypothetical protein
MRVRVELWLLCENWDYTSHKAERTSKDGMEKLTVAQIRPFCSALLA